jgi:hypothetical protein
MCRPVERATDTDAQAQRVHSQPSDVSADAESPQRPRCPGCAMACRRQRNGAETDAELHRQVE